MLSNIAERTWFHDLEIVTEENQAYVLLIKNLARISNIPVSDVSEAWTFTDRLPPKIRVDYKIRKQAFRFHIYRHSDYIHPAVLFLLNEQLYLIDPRFEMSFHESCVYLLSKTEKREMESAGLKFESADSISYFDIILFNIEELLPVTESDLAYQLLMVLEENIEKWKEKHLHSKALNEIKLRVKKQIFPYLDWKYMTENKLNLEKLYNFVQET